jgi:TonB-dependent SusC/RagA subfamily outer membrane receptor
VRTIAPILVLITLVACSAERGLAPAPQPQKSALLGCNPHTSRCDQPLLFVDGKRTPWDGSKDLDPATIETVEVIKGTTALARYGHDGRNGVVFITTKKGRL